MDEAIVVFSRKGVFQTTIAARDVRSREHARKLWPLVSPGASRQKVTWVSPSFESGKLRRRSHFRVLPAHHTFNPKAHFDDEDASRWRPVPRFRWYSRASSRSDWVDSRSSCRIAGVVRAFLCKFRFIAGRSPGGSFRRRACRLSGTPCLFSQKAKHLPG